jgi:tetraacyldisaccharide 4'-kinase
MREPAFWQSSTAISTVLMRPLGAIYKTLGRWRRQLTTPQTLSAPVICIGNITVGGSGKTPVVDFLSDWLKAENKAPAILSRGYKGKLLQPTQVDRSQHDAQMVGDEPLMLASRHNVFIGADRYQTGSLAIGKGFDCLIKDDGFQNPKLAHDLNVIVVDGQTGFGNGYIFPAGPLREPWSDALRRAQAIVLIGDPSHPSLSLFLAAAEAKNIVILKAKIETGKLGFKKALPLFAYCGLAKPEKFIASLNTAGLKLVGQALFADHHFFSEADAKYILEQANKLGAVPITTEKDFARLAGAAKDSYRAQLAEASQLLTIKLQLKNKASLTKLVRPILTREA